MTNSPIQCAARFVPSYIVESAWLEHAPFAAWLISSLKPRRLVELGTHSGYSYFAFCEAVQQFGTATQCYAVDTFRGDEHAGFYGEDVYRNVLKHHRQFEAFSHVLRSSFEEALPSFEDGSIDVLHIDGRHFYDDVKEDFESWLPKLTPTGIVLFHDISVTDRNFGVGRLFGELAHAGNHFAFTHNNGLGVLAPNETPIELRALLSSSDSDAAEFRDLMEGLGKRITLTFDGHRLSDQLKAARLQTAEDQSICADLNRHVADVEASLANERLKSNRLEELVASALSRVRAARNISDRLQLENQDLSNRLRAIETSTFWRMTSGPRSIASVTPKSIVKTARLLARASYWAATPQQTGMRLRYLKEGGLKKVLAREPSTEQRPDDRAAYMRWVHSCDTLTAESRERIESNVQAMVVRPTFSIVMPVYNTPEDILNQTIQSVCHQLYPHWQLCIADDASTDPNVATVLKHWQSVDARIKFVQRKENGHISASSNSALALATGDYVVLLDHDDILSENALYEVAKAIVEHPNADILYSDEDKVDEDGIRSDPYFKPDFSYDLMLGQNLINHLGVYRRRLVADVGGFREGFEGSQDYDLALRCLEKTDISSVIHIPKILYHWRQPAKAKSFSQTALERCVAASRKALSEHLAAMSKGSDDAPSVTANPAVWSWNRVTWPLPKLPPLVSVIIPTRDHATLLRQCVDGLLHRTSYKNIEVIIADNGSSEPETARLFDELSRKSNITVVDVAGPFNYSRINNVAVARSQGDIVVLMNNDIDVIESNWLSEMVSLAVRPDVGCVGAKLLYGDGRVQHAGVRLGAGQFDGGPGVAGHLGLFASANDVGYFGSYVLPHEVSAVTAACLAVRRSIYEEVGGLNESDLAVAFNDIDFCLRVAEAGYRNIWTPHATLFHLESASRGSDLTPEKAARFYGEARYMRQRWGPLLDFDRFYSGHFDSKASDYQLNMRY